MHLNAFVARSPPRALLGELTVLLLSWIKGGQGRGRGGRRRDEREAKGKGERRVEGRRGEGWREAFPQFNHCHHVCVISLCAVLDISGARIINTNLLLRVEQQRKTEQKIVDDIKKKMDRIRERHMKERNKRTRELDEPTPDKQLAVEQLIYLEPTDHYEGQHSLRALHTH